MQHLDLLVVRQALKWSAAGQRVWLCTVLSTYGSAPRAPGSLLAATAQGDFCIAQGDQLTVAGQQ